MEIKDIFKLDAMEKDRWRNEVSNMTNSPDDVIQELLSVQQLMLLAAEKGLGKTCEFLNLQYCLGYGGMWHGLKVAPCPNLYLGWEGNPKKIGIRLDKIGQQYIGRNKLHPCYFKMMPHKIPLDTLAGRNELKNMVKELKPEPRVILLDPFKRTVSPGYSRPEIGDAWIEGASQVCRDISITIICAAHTNKLTYTKGREEDFTDAKIKGCGDILDGMNAIVMIGEEKGSRRTKEIDDKGEEYSKVVWAVLSRIIKVTKAKDASGEVPMLRVKFDRERLIHSGQEWVVNKDYTITVESSERKVRRADRELEY